MKKLISMFLIIISLITFYFTYQQTWFNESQRVSSLENKIGLQFTISDHLALSGHEEVYEFITSVGKKLNVNVYRSTVKANSNDQLEYVKYVLINKPTKYFNTFSLKSGRFLNKKDLGSDFYLSTYDNSDANQIGVLKNFAGKINVIIKPFNKFGEFLPTAGTYTIETHDKNILYKFVNELCNVINNYYKDILINGKGYAPEDFLISNPVNEISSLNILILLKVSLFILVAILSMLYIYYVCQASKQIGIMKLNGLSTLRIWYKIICLSTIKIFSLINFLCLAMIFFIKDVCLSFLFSFLMAELFMLLVILFCSFVSIIFISNTKPNLIIKNKDASYIVFLMNSFVKIIVFIMAMMIMTIAYSKYQNLNLQCKIKNNWAKSIDYGVFYPMHIQDDYDDDLHGAPKKTYRLATKLYPLLNKMGALLINSQQFEELDFILNPQRQFRYLTVNNNFLNEFPIYDVYDKKINISEDAKNVIILVPEKFKSRKLDICKFFAEDLEKNLSIDSNNKDISEADKKVQDRKFKIIFIRDKQKVFSFNTDVFPTENNLIVDPIIKIINENNSSVYEKDVLLGGGCRDPLKIKLINRDVELTYKTLLPYLKEYKLDDSYTTLVTVDQYISTMINDIKKEMNLIFSVIIFCVLIIVLLVSENISIYFNRSSKKIITKRLFGFSFSGIHLKYIIYITATSIFQMLIFFLVNYYLNSHVRNMIDVIDIDLPLTFILICVSVLEMIIFFSVVSKLETKNLARILKGGL